MKKNKPSKGDRNLGIFHAHLTFKKAILILKHSEYFKQVLNFLAKLLF